jgi:hypothetical protein
MQDWMWEVAIGTGIVLGLMFIIVQIVKGIVWCCKTLHNMQERNHERMVEFIDKHIEMEKAKQ